MAKNLAPYIFQPWIPREWVSVAVLWFFLQALDAQEPALCAIIRLMLYAEFDPGIVLLFPKVPIFHL